MPACTVFHRLQMHTKLTRDTSSLHASAILQRLPYPPASSVLSRSSESGAASSATSFSMPCATGAATEWAHP